MARHSETSPARARAPSKRLIGAKGRRIVRTLAQRTLLAAGIAATQFTIPEVDPKYPIFDPTLVDRLQAPVTRYHE
jgi:hypothetical protein